jgi:tetraacyldisaccharide 4'-kinase
MSILRWLAAPLSPLYGGVVRARNRAFDAHPERAARLACPVISVGNLSTGGTGKTPVTLYLAQALDAMGWPNAILSRGYGGKRTVDPMDVQPESDPRQTGDEPLLMARRLGPNRVVVARKRQYGGLRALDLAPKPKVLLLDDGFQHRALHRDVDLLLLDGVRTWGNGRMLPLGDLREPMEYAKRAHALVVTRASRVKDRPAIEAWWSKQGSGGPIFWLDFRIGALRNVLSGERIALPEAAPPPGFAWCGLGHPQAFFADLLVAGVPWVATESFGDHEIPSLRKFLLLQHRAIQEGATRLICTEKDAVKLKALHLQTLTLPLLAAEQEVVGGEALAAWVLARLTSL